MLRHAKSFIRFHFLSKLRSFSEEVLSVGFSNNFLDMLDLILDFLFKIIIGDCKVESISLLIECIPLLNERILPFMLKVYNAISFECLLEILNKHEKFTRFQLLKSSLLLNVISPEGILATESAFILGFLAIFSIILALLPWVLHFQESDHGAIWVSVFYKGFGNYTLTCLQTLALIEALSRDHMLFPKIK